MDIRAQVSMVFHLDKCIGCHTCSIACKNIWTDRKGAEYMWWNNVETKPGTGYPTKWEDQGIYKGGWEKKNGAIGLRGAGKKKGLLNIFHNPHMPTIDDYYEPFTYKYLNLIESPEKDIQPTARPVSLITGKPIDIKMGPNWDDDLSGTLDFARQDPNLKNLTTAEAEAMFQLEKMALYYLPILDAPYPDAHSFLIDSHIIYILVLFFFAFSHAGEVYGLDGRNLFKKRR